MFHMVKNLSAMQEPTFDPWLREDRLEKDMATDSSILAWRIPWTEKPDRLRSMESQSQTQLKWLSAHE